MNCEVCENHRWIYDFGGIKTKCPSCRVAPIKKDDDLKIDKRSKEFKEIKKSKGA